MEVPVKLQFRVRLFAASLVFAVLAGGVVTAQDTRTVTEPHFPQPCAVLRAQLAAPGGRLSGKDESRLDTARIQQAIDRCAKGKAVELKSNGVDDVFLAGPLRLRSGVTLLIDEGTVLDASRDPRLYDITPGSCGVVDRKGHGCRPLILADDAPGSAVMGDGSIDGRGGETLLGQKVSWWDLAHTAKVTDQNQSCFRLIVVHRSNGFILYRITLRNSPMFHVLVEQTNGFTAWGVTIDTPKTARNTDGIDPASSTNVSILYSSISDGDDDVAIKAGNMGPSTHMTIAHDHFYYGHGMSIGSETNAGASDILVKDLTIDGADNGIRIKSDRSRGGLVKDVTYRNVCMRDVKNPLFFTPLYSRREGKLLPEYRGIVLDNVHILTPGRLTIDGLDKAHRLGMTFDNVWDDGIAESKMQASFAQITVGPQVGNLIPRGKDVTITKAAGSHPGTPYSCKGRFVPLPGSAAAESAENVPPVDKTLYVAADGSGDYSSVQQAVDAAPATGATILVAPGVYREAVTIDKPNIRLIGSSDDAARAVIVDDKSAGTSGGTMHSATVTARGNHFVAENITFENDWNATHPQLPKGSQALALLVSGDQDAFRNVRLLGNQDTLYAGSRHCSSDKGPCVPARQYFSHCYIAGNVDFVFGDGKAVFSHCELHSTAHKGGFITAQSKHYPGEDSGFLFRHCRLTAAPGVGKVYLGRPWRPYATVIFLGTEMGPEIAPAGWREWHPGETHSLRTAYYAEYDSTGPGADTAQREPYSHQLTAAQAKHYSTLAFLDGWNPKPELKHAEVPSHR
jgi:polygalacturonase